MPVPIPIALGYLEGGGPWVLVAENILSATIQLTKVEFNPEDYRKIYVLTGDSAPVGNASGETKVTDEIIEIAHSEPIDVYMRYVGDSMEGGEVVVSA